MPNIFNQTGGTGTPKIDLGGCVLYLPLHRTDMVSRGGRIVQGTGTMAVSPLGLSVGINSVEALTAGTFLIYSPYGGTCASDGATITGSPVTLNTGGLTTVTTGVTTGTFTVTTNNVIKSKDSISRSCTITGATWGITGGNFDGVDDFLTIPNAPALNPTAGITLAAWIKPSANGMIFTKDGGMAGTRQWQLRLSSGKLYVRLWNSSDTEVGVTGNTPVTMGVWHYVAVTYNKDTGVNNLILYLNGQADGNGTQTGDIKVTTRVLYLASGEVATSPIPFKGTIGEVLIYNRGLTLSEVQNNYLATKWRYK